METLKINGCEVVKDGTWYEISGRDGVINCGNCGSEMDTEKIYNLVCNNTFEKIQEYEVKWLNEPENMFYYNVSKESYEKLSQLGQDYRTFQPMQY